MERVVDEKRLNVPAAGAKAQAIRPALGPAADTRRAGFGREPYARRPPTQPIVSPPSRC
jgi:hypothetical protein